MKFALRWLAVATLLALVGACSTSPTRPSRAAPAAHYSGFLANYSDLRADPGDPGYLRYVAPGVTAARYHKFIIEPPAFIVNTAGNYQSLDPERVLAASKYYETRMAAALAAHYQVVTAPGPGVARLRVAVVGLIEVRAPLTPGDFVPLKALFDLGRQVVGKSPHVLRMSFESEAVDAQTGRLLGEAVDSRESTHTVAGQAQPGDEQLHALIDFWIARFVSRLDKANGYAS